MSKFQCIPAIDVREGRVVRLSQGDYSRQTEYADAPQALAARYAAEGAEWLHLVDLDAARLGAYSLQTLVATIRAETPLKIQTGGGIRSQDELENLLALGVERVVVGTMAIREPTRICGWLRTYGNAHITLALDARQDASGIWQLPVAGWTESSDQSLESLLSRYADAGLQHVLCTDIARDGMLAGFNLELYRRLSTRWPKLQLQASGGVRSIEDIVAAREAGASAAILGRGLLENRFTLADALAC